MGSYPKSERRARRAAPSSPTAARRRSAGEGSIYQALDGRWRGAIAWTEPDGRRLRRVVAGRTAAEARGKLDELRARLRTGTLEPAGTGNLGDYLSGWVERERQRLRPSTWRQREQYTRCYLVPALGRRALVQLTPADVERMTAGLIASGRSPQTASHARVILRRALADAQRDGLIARNVAALARPPRVTGRTIEPGRDYLTAAQLRILLSAAAVHPVGPLVTVAATTGLRQGELLGLSWDDLDAAASTLTVRRALALAWGGGMELAEPKTGRSRRTVHLPALASAALERQRDLQATAREAAGTAWQDRDRLIFTDAVGRPLYRTAVHRTFHELLTVAGLPSIPFHGLRHSAATALLTAGVPLRVVSDLLGHSGITITSDYYAHVEHSLRRDAADAMDRALGG
ncbi:MAG: site-specific integrase [Chloroflexi bacterium]|nr:MAG: site-specific integrase [Chloroflexota bacterium]